ncbi:hypothetical protein CLV59_105207 [Chitinophaga dinghuensis]|uniref:Uncharacterized protein n=1 Tax=Chitinophaga dinghuensis TaxID=1539050 RepID=A0A327VY31_9BACT|nr:hypothetical protein CLV59_105207 [Chitinophaga dinghuensis]
MVSEILNTCISVQQATGYTCITRVICWSSAATIWRATEQNISSERRKHILPVKRATTPSSSPFNYKGINSY